MSVCGPGPSWPGAREIDVPAVDVEPPHSLGQLCQEGLAVLRPAGHHLDTQLLARAVLGGAGHEDDQPFVAVVDEVEPELDAGEDAVVGEVEIDVVDRSLGERWPAGPARQAGQATPA